MAQVRPEIVEILRTTANKIESSSNYQWGHMGLCNCGFLAQQITSLTKEQIHTRAMQRHGDWNEQLNDYCPTSGLPMDDLISELISFGFDSDDLKHLEKLSDRRVLRMMPFEERNLKHNLKKDVVKYIRIWASILENQLIENIHLNLDVEEKITVEV